MKTGNRIINLGFKPDFWFKDAIKYIDDNNLTDEEIVIHCQNIINSIPKFIEPFKNPIAYFKNIKATSPEDEENINNVYSDMDIIMKSPTIITGAIMPDACPVGNGHIPVGGVAVTKNAIHPAMHSADICCSVMLTNLGYVSPKSVLDIAFQTTHFGPGGRNEYSELPKKLEENIKENIFLNSDFSIKLAKNHLGTQGDGNHFLFVGKLKSTNETVIVTHHGSRGFGANLYKLGIKTAEKYRKKISPLSNPTNAWIPFNTIDGENYWEALQIVREWTKLNHKTIHDAILNKLKINALDNFWNEHNFVFKDNDLFYHAKGATPLDEKFVPDSKNGLRLIPLNMGESILIVKGETSENNLGFAPHGAGRNLSRSAHKKLLSHKTIEEIFNEETKNLDIRFFSKNIDISELPSAYKKSHVVKQQIEEFGLGTIIDEVIPYGSIMAGNIIKKWQR